MARAARARARLAHASIAAVTMPAAAAAAAAAPVVAAPTLYKNASVTLSFTSVNNANAITFDNCVVRLAFVVLQTPKLQFINGTSARLVHCDLSGVTGLSAQASTISLQHCNASCSAQLAQSTLDVSCCTWALPPSAAPSPQLFALLLLPCTLLLTHVDFNVSATTLVKYTGSTPPEYSKLQLRYAALTHRVPCALCPPDMPNTPFWTYLGFAMFNACIGIGYDLVHRALGVFSLAANGVRTVLATYA